MLVGLLLLPVCAGAAIALTTVIRHSGKADTTWIAMLSGAACWIAIYLLLPKPMWIYVVGHELTHAVWTWLMGGRVKKFNATSSGGHVVVTKSNFLVALAPYFFPLYAVLIVAGFFVIGAFWDLGAHQVWFHLLLGAAYAFHITLTIHILRQSQSDITSQGCIFSASIIFLGNAVVLLLGIPLVLKQVSVMESLVLWWTATSEVVQSGLRWAAGLGPG
jgi:hypothetical protein